MSRSRFGLWAGTLLALATPVAGAAAEDTVATAVYAKIGQGYKRTKAKDGTYKPEYYALSNGGLIHGTITDKSIDRVTYPQVAEIAKRVLALQNYHYAKTSAQAKLLLVLNWGSTLAPNGMRKDMNIADARTALGTLQLMQGVVRNNPEKQTSGPGGFLSYPGEDVAANTAAGFGPSSTAGSPLNEGSSSSRADNEVMAIHDSAHMVENQILQSLTDDRVRDRLNENNARILGFLDDLSDSNDIRRYAGGGDRYSDLITEVEEGRYYIVVSAYDFKELTQREKKKLLWQVRVSVRSGGNSFNESLIAMMKTASRYFGQNSGKLVRSEVSKGSVELGDLRFLGVTKTQEKPPTQEKK